MITYKASLHESIAIKVDANYTSKACPMCGHTCDANRPDKGLLFICQKCHYTLHADLVGARNITMRTLLVRQDWIRTGQLSVVPGSSDSDVSSAEAKAARLKRYAELRWSLYQVAFSRVSLQRCLAVAACLPCLRSPVPYCTLERKLVLDARAEWK